LKTCWRRQLALNSLGNYDQAIEYYSTLAIDPNNIVALKNRANLQSTIQASGGEKNSNDIDIGGNQSLRKQEYKR